MAERSITYNIAQAGFILNHKKINVFEGGRGIGKSTIMGKVMALQVNAMPRGTGVLVGSTFVQILTRTLPSTIRGLEMHGLYKDLHYFVGRRAPKEFNFPEPFEPPLDYKHCIHFYNGFVYRMVSQDRPGSGRGINSDCILGDEAALLDKTDLDDSVVATCRGTNPEAFRHSKYYCSQFYFTSTPTTQAGEWIYEIEDLANKEPEKYSYTIAPSIFNIHNLGSDYFRHLKKTMYPARWDAEIMCKRNKKIIERFYPLLNMKRHGYSSYDYDYVDTTFDVDNLPDYYEQDCRIDADLNVYQELLIGLDFGAAINSLVVGQMDEATNTLNLINNLFVLGIDDQILDDLADKFVAYYKYHNRKVVQVFYDNTGNNSQANSRYTLTEEFCAILRKAGWTAIPKTKGGSNPNHEQKYRLWSKCLQEKDNGENRKLPYIRINANNCKELVVSMENAPAKKSGKGLIQKDKSSERRLKGAKRIQATDLSDAADTLVYGIGEGWLYIIHDKGIPTHIQ